MARTLSELRSLLTELLAYDLDNSASTDGVAVTAAELVTQLNTAARWISLQIYQYDPKVALTTVSGQASYAMRSMAKKMVKIDRVVIEERVLRSYNGCYGMWSQTAVDDAYPQWRTAASGDPSVAWQVGETLWLYPAPDANGMSNCHVAGQYICAALTNGSDDANSYDLPEELHEAVAYAAAIFAATPTASDQEAINRLSTYDRQAAKWIQEVGTRNRKMLQPKATFASRRIGMVEL
jgi:hypothetical protein